MLHFIAFLLLNIIAYSHGGDNLKNSAEHGDYIGCYDQKCLRFDYNVKFSGDAITTPSTCTATCQENGFSLAGLYNRSRCSCLCQQTCLTKPREDRNCGVPCRNDSSVFCGSFIAASLYTVNSFPSSEICSYLKKETTTTAMSPGGPGDDPKNESLNLAIPVSIPTVICMVIVVIIIVFVCRRRRRLRREAIPQPTSIQKKGPKDKSNKHYQGLNEPPTGLPTPPDPYVPHPMPQNTSDKHLYHLYAEADQQRSSTSHQPHGQIPSSGLSATVTSPNVQSTSSTGKERSDSDEYHEYTYADQVKPKPKISDGARANEDEGYIIPDGSSPSPRPQVVYYSSKIARHHGKDDAGQLQPKPKSSDSAAANDREEDHTADGPSPSPSPQEVYYSSKIPRGPGEDKVPRPQRPSPAVYYSSRIKKPAGK